MRFLLLWLLLTLSAVVLQAQQGTLTGNVTDDKKQPLENATVALISFTDSTQQIVIQTDKTGLFLFEAVLFGYYKLRISYVGLQALLLDSIYLRKERSDFNLADLVLKPKSTESLEEIIVYAEKPLIQTRDGNITFNAGESALSQGSNAGDLLTQVPLVTKDPNGKLLVRGKEPKILIDDKPVELNLQQLQDLLESMPGSSIEKIEVMTNPPAQYATEQGGVINITTRKGAVGISGRISLYAGTREEVGTNGSFTYRKNGFSLNANAGVVQNRFDGEGYSIRQNLYKDSSNFFNTNNSYLNKNTRPNFRANIDYEISKQHLLNAVILYSGNNYNNNNNTFYQNINRFDALYRLSNRNIASRGSNFNPNLSATYTYKPKTPGETFRFFANYYSSGTESNRQFYQQYLATDYSFTPGNDSTQLQLTDNATNGYQLRVSYDKSFSNKKTSISTGSYFTGTTSDVDVTALYKPKNADDLKPLDLLSNHFIFHQSITNIRASVKQVLGQNFSITGGLAIENTAIKFDLLKTGTDTSNSYWTFLPFANLNKGWNNNLNLTLSYRRTIRRPGINELNPTRDFSDPYNIRSGNPGLLASPAHQFDLVVGKNAGALYLNMGIGYNSVEAIYNQIRTLLPNGTTETIWQNISGRKEYEFSTWSGYSFSKKLRMNVSTSYIHNVYSGYDKEVRKYRDGGSLTSNLNANYIFKELYTATGNFTFNRFANPQGPVRSNMSMNLGLQARLLNKKMTVSLNIIDPIIQQQNRSFIYGPNFTVENYSATQTRNYRLTLGYTISKAVKKPVKNAANLIKSVKPIKK